MKHCPTCQHCYEDAQAVCPEDNSALVETRAGAGLLAGKYRLDVLLGRGDQGTAYEATEVGDGRPVIAVELLRAEVLSDPRALERFHAAAQAAGRNNGQEVGEIRDSGPLPGGGAYVVMELIEEDAGGHDVAVAAPEQADTPTVVARGADTGRLRPPGRNTGRLSKVAAELTQEVPRLPVPLPPPAPPDTAPARDAGAAEIAARPRETTGPHPPPAAPHAAPAESASRPAPRAVDTPRRDGPRRPSSYYLGLVITVFGIALLLTLAASWLRRAPDSGPESRAAGPGPPATLSPAPAAPVSRQATAPVSAQTSPAAAAGTAGAPGAESGDGTNASSRGASRSANSRAEARELLDDWVAAVVARDVDKLMTFYAPELETFYDKREVAASPLRAELTRLFGRAERVEARVLGEPRINIEDGGRAATVRLRLGYAVEDKGGRRRRGEVSQELRLVKTGDRWKISGQSGENMPR